MVGAKKKGAIELMDRLQVNQFLKRAQKSAHFKERIIEKIAHLLGLLAVEEEERTRIVREGEDRADQVDHLARKTGYLQERLHMEEEVNDVRYVMYIVSKNMQHLLLKLLIIWQN